MASRRPSWYLAVFLGGLLLRNPRTGRIVGRLWPALSQRTTQTRPPNSLQVLNATQRSADADTNFRIRRARRGPRHSSMSRPSSFQIPLPAAPMLLYGPEH
ncbi:hypothetical protein AcV5_003447 [Taiwanofungus camphoratus]|nr:hypothetical protein AcV5_003447 [Antrodia cinnamomea]